MTQHTPGPDGGYHEDRNTHYERTKALLEEAKWREFLAEETISSETEAALKYFDLNFEELNGPPPVSKPLETTMESFTEWCKGEHTASGRPKKMETPIRSINALERYARDLGKTLNELPADSQLNLARPPIIAACYELKMSKRHRVEATLIELLNSDGMYLTFDGLSLELNSGGPAFSIVISDYTYGEPSKPFNIYSQEAFQEQFQALFNPYAMNIRASYDNKALPSLIEEARMIIEDLYGNEKNIEDASPEDFQYIPTTYGTLQCNTKLGKFEVKLHLDQTGLVDAHITKLD